MKIMMVTNAYTPHVNGVARSVAQFAAEYRRQWHDVMVVAPYTLEKLDEPNVIRIPCVNPTPTTSVPLTIYPGARREMLKQATLFEPDVIHAHHPFLLGDAARLISVELRVPLVFTHHTMYEEHARAYIEANHPKAHATKEMVASFANNLSTEYANLCDHVIAPSQSTADILLDRGVIRPVTVVPTGVEVERFANADRMFWRNKLNIGDAPLLGHVGRLSPEKNLTFLLKAVRSFLRRHTRVHFLLVGDGPAKDATYAQLGERCHAIGSRSGAELANAFKALDVFVFSSLSETQGMVLTEAMSAGVPVVAIDAPGARDVVLDKENGRLVQGDVNHFCNAIRYALEHQKRLSHGAYKTALEFSQRACADKALAVYKSSSYGSKKVRMLRHIASRLTR